MSVLFLPGTHVFPRNFFVVTSLLLKLIALTVHATGSDNNVVTYDDIGTKILTSFAGLEQGGSSSSKIGMTNSDEEHVVNLASAMSKFDLKSLIAHQLYDQFVEKLQKTPSECTRDFVFFLDALKNKKTWAIQAADSFGRPRSGVLKGNLKWTGNYDECRELHIGPQNLTEEDVPMRMKFEAQYCQAGFMRLGQPELMVPGAGILNELLIGLCLPSSCNETTASKTMKDALEFAEIFIHPGKMFEYVGVTCPKPATSLDLSAQIAIAVLFLLLALVVLGTAFESFQSAPRLALPSNLFVRSEANGVTDNVSDGPEEHTDTQPIIGQQNGGPSQVSVDHGYTEQNIAAKILTCFSVVSNGKKLLSMETDRHDLGALHGIRFLSLTWIILGHTFFFGFGLTSNPLDILDVTKHGLFFQSITQAVFAVDTFFLLSGCLVAYNFFLHMERNSDNLHSLKFWASFYAHRIWRLTPTYAAILCVYVGLWKYMGSGPYWPAQGFEIENCKRTWWTNLLYINNLVDIYFNGTDGVPHREYCMGWTWYLSNDMQFFVMSPLLLYPLQRGMSSVSAGVRGTIWRAVGWAFLLLLAVISMAVVGGISSAHDLPPNLFPPNVSKPMADKIEYMMNNIAFQPYNHAVCYLMGITAGYTFCLLRTRNSHGDPGDRPRIYARIPKIWMVCGWGVALLMAFFVVFGLWPEYRGHVYTTSMAAFYDACSRFGWSLVVGWVIFACLSGNGGPVQSLLSWKVFVPLSRMTYCAYLIHPMIMYWFYFSRRDSYYYTDFTMTWFFGAFVMFSYMAAFGVTLVFESPFLALDKLMFPARRAKPKE